jgi:hypothetical protein
MVNAEHEVSGVLSAPAWNVLATLGVLLVWGTPEGGWGRIRKPWLRGAGVALLLFVALAYRNPEVTGWIHLRPYWWGILGLIGWAYLGVATVYLLSGDRPAVLVSAVALFYCVALADAAGSMAWLSTLRPVVGPVIALCASLAGPARPLRRYLQAGPLAPPRRCWATPPRWPGCSPFADGVPRLHHQQNYDHAPVSFVGSDLRRLWPCSSWWTSWLPALAPSRSRAKPLVPT